MFTKICALLRRKSVETPLAQEPIAKPKRKPAVKKVAAKKAISVKATPQKKPAVKKAAPKKK